MNKIWHTWSRLEALPFLTGVVWSSNKEPSMELPIDKSLNSPIDWRQSLSFTRCWRASLRLLRLRLVPDPRIIHIDIGISKVLCSCAFENMRSLRVLYTTPYLWKKLQGKKFGEAMPLMNWRQSLSLTRCWRASLRLLRLRLVPYTKIMHIGISKVLCSCVYENMGSSRVLYIHHV